VSETTLKRDLGLDILVSLGRVQGPANELSNYFTTRR
jgi:hypothetical protein